MPHRIGTKVKMTRSAIENYGEKYAGKTFTVTHRANKYMPAAQFYAKGQPEGYHPGYDEEAGGFLYDLEGLNMSLYGWELENA